ncbi:hypothetical protein BS50DRAFT_571973 [Corynespora cassiicola Philippines]|uniref:Uncharacterized protein n=1 Tax=Corynespora cassiicola Philippines TaxID=1448308 RepID=A0A2T2NTR7_CORCC|nr:hypothetical protein BS50DRAFT_571973 [Corynespora cassiicola Philippines]
METGPPRGAQVRSQIFFFWKIPRSSSTFQDANIADGETKNTFQIPTAFTFCERCGKVLSRLPVVSLVVKHEVFGGSEVPWSAPPHLQSLGKPQTPKIWAAILTPSEAIVSAGRFTAKTEHSRHGDDACKIRRASSRPCSCGGLFSGLGSA